MQGHFVLVVDYQVSVSTLMMRHAFTWIRVPHVRSIKSLCLLLPVCPETQDDNVCLACEPDCVGYQVGVFNFKTRANSKDASSNVAGLAIRK
tara:strand:- start:21 stop:296 length:276 start_codon:yes stop_codon:yes gene_type:complete